MSPSHVAETHGVALNFVYELTSRQENSNSVAQISVSLVYPRPTRLTQLPIHHAMPSDSRVYCTKTLV